MWGNFTQSGHTECNLLFLRYRPFVSVLSLRFFKDTFQIGVREYFLFDLFCQSVLYLSNTTFSVYILSVILLSFLLFSFSLFLKPFSIFISVLFFDVIFTFFHFNFLFRENLFINQTGGGHCHGPLKHSCLSDQNLT